MNYIPELSSIDLRRSPIDSNSRPPIGSLIAMLRSPRAHGMRMQHKHFCPYVVLSAANF